MAVIVTPDIFDRGNNSRIGEEKYPFDEWTDGKPRVFIKGEDFTGTAVSFSNTFRAAMKRRGLKGRCRVLDEDNVAGQVIHE